MNYWDEQGCHVEILIEKQSMAASFRKVAKGIQVVVIPTKGDDSLEDQYKHYRRWKKIQQEEGKFGFWAWDVAFSPSEVRLIVNKHAERLSAEDPFKVSAKCPLCHREANGREEVEQLFGYRNADGFVRVQSWCRHCRSKNPGYIK